MSPLPPRNVLSPIKPKERKGEMSRAITLASIKNALEEIGNNEEDSNYEKPATKHCNNPFDSDIDDDTLKHSPSTKKEIRGNETIKKLNIHAEKDIDNVFNK